MKKLFLTAFLLLITANLASAKNTDWKKFDSRYFVVFYKNAPFDFVKNVSETADELYNQIPRNLGFVRYQSWSYEQRAAI